MTQKWPSNHPNENEGKRNTKNRDHLDHIRCHPHTRFAVASELSVGETRTSAGSEPCVIKGAVDAMLIREETR